MYTVITSFSPAGWNMYARTFVESFYEFFPPEVALVCYYEGTKPPYEHPFPGRDLLALEPCASFLARHRHDPVIHGKVERGPARWGPKAKREHYSFRHDAYKFARKVFAVADAARRQQRGRLFWIDADVVVKRKVPLELLWKLLPDDASLCYLPRRMMHSENGFVGYNLDHIETHAFITAYEAEYSEDVFLRRACWDDCNVFDGLVHELKPAVAPIANIDQAHPFEGSILGKFMVHLKGNRKITL